MAKNETLVKPKTLEQTKKFLELFQTKQTKEIAKDYKIHRKTVYRWKVHAEKLIKELSLKPKIRVKAETSNVNTTKVTVIADFHDNPSLDKNRAKWIGRHINKERPDRVVIIGDFADLTSLCSHVRNETYNGRLKGTFEQDLASMKEALQTLTNEIKYDVQIDLTLGNHEHRLWLFEDKNPEIYGMMQHAFLTVLNDFKIYAHPYGKFLMIDGVGFTHIPFNGMGKPYGGMNASMSAARDSVFDCVFGHTHRFNVHTRPKLGGKRIRVVDVGTSLPQGHIEDYAKHSMTGWSWGITDIKICQNSIEDVNFISMSQLEEKYEI